MAVRVVVVEASARQRRDLVGVLDADDALTVVGEAASGDEAVRVVAATAPDVVTMDLELPGDDGTAPGGVAAIAAVMAATPVPILVVSARVAAREDPGAVAAIAAGAVDCVAKAACWTPEASAALRRRVLVVSRLTLVTRPRRGAPTPSERATGRGAVIALAASTGGPSAIRDVLRALVGVQAPILLVQHLHADFAASFVTWLAEVTGLRVGLAGDGGPAVEGCVHVAPPGLHLRLGPHRTLELHRLPELLTRPSADELLRSVAEEAGALGVGGVLTGMGADGARGLLALRERGGVTFAQDAASSVVDGMPRAARELDAAQHVLTLEALGPAVADAARRVGAP